MRDSAKPWIAMVSIPGEGGPNFSPPSFCLACIVSEASAIFAANDLARPFRAAEREDVLQRHRYSPYEFGLVISVAFGWAILASLMSFLYGKTVGEAGAPDSFGREHLYGVVITELICLPVVAAILYARGWRAKDFPMGIGKASTILGIVAFTAAWVVDYVFTAAFALLFDSLRPAFELVANYKPAHPPDFVAVYVLSVINPVFEELIVCGYVIPVIASRYGLTTAINVSVIIRGLYHLYQGIAFLPFHLAYGLMQAYLFARFNRLWPLIVSHAIFDFAALTYFI